MLHLQTNSHTERQGKGFWKKFSQHSEAYSTFAKTKSLTPFGFCQRTKSGEPHRLKIFHNQLVN